MRRWWRIAHALWAYVHSMNAVEGALGAVCKEWSKDVTNWQSTHNAWPFWELCSIVSWLNFICTRRKSSDQVAMSRPRSGQKYFPCFNTGIHVLVNYLLPVANESGSRCQRVNIWITRPVAQYGRSSISRRRRDPLLIQTLGKNNKPVQLRPIIIQDLVRYLTDMPGHWESDSKTYCRDINVRAPKKWSMIQLTHHPEDLCLVSLIFVKE